MIDMKTKQAVNFVLRRHNLTKYALAQRVGSSPTSINQWQRRTRMSKAYATKFYEEFKIVVTDAV